MASGDSQAEADRAAELIQGGADLAGASVGAAIGLIGGPPGALGGAAAGVAATRLFRRLGSEIHQRSLGPRQRERVGAAFAVAAQLIAMRLKAGETPRSDGFFDASSTGRPPAEELLEGVLLASADAYEEWKVPFLGKLYAALVFDEGVSRPFANFLIALAQRLTCRQLALMAVIWDGDAAPLAARAAQNAPPTQIAFSDELGLEVDELERLGLVGRGEPGGTPKRGGATFVDASGLAVTSLTLTGPGKRMYDLMDLRSIPEQARAEVLADLVRVEPQDPREMGTANLGPEPPSV